MRRRSEQLTPVSSSTLAVPTMVERMSARAVAAESPLVIPASSKASITRPRNAGPDPASAVAASKSRSSSVTTVPIRPSQPSTRVSASEPVNGPLAKHSVPAPTLTPTFGMQRKSGTPCSRTFSSVVVPTPAATETTAVSGPISSDASRSTRSTSIGLTAIRTTSARCTSSALSATCWTPRRSARRAARPEPRSVTRMRSPSDGSARSQPSTIAPAMLPAPIEPRIVVSLTRRMVLAGG